MWGMSRIGSRLVPRTLDTFKQCCSTQAIVNSRQKLFYDEKVQSLLKSLTGLNQQKIFRARRDQKPRERSVYQFLTDEELAALQEEFTLKAEKKIQMPPVMTEREPKGRVLEEDPHLVGFDISKHVFTDITFGVSDRERIVVVRDPDGTLRTANWEEQDRVNQTYYPREGRKHKTPPMFEPEQLETLLGPEKYEYILDRNCVQFEPDHPLYIRTAEMVYNHIIETKNFDTLHSTRHYGPLVFHMCCTNQIDEFIIHLILKKDLESAANVVEVFVRITKDPSVVIVSGSAEHTIRNFASSPASKKQQKIMMALEKVV